MINTTTNIDAVFKEIYERLEKISDAETFKQSHKCIKKTAIDITKLAKEKCFSIKYEREISLKECSYANFVKAMEIKARDATGIVPSIDSCQLKEINMSMGFTRTIKIGNHEVIQRIWECKRKNRIKIVFQTYGSKFIATNELKKKNGKIIFTARYIVDEHPKYTTADWFLKNVMDPTFDNLKNLSINVNLSKRHKAVVIDRS